MPEEGWGHLVFADSSPAAGRAYTDDGAVHEHRGLKGRTKGRPNPKARRPVRKVPIPPQLVALLRDHMHTYNVALDGRLFRSENGTPLQPSTWWQVWQKVRAASLTPEQLASPLMKRPYDARESCALACVQPGGAGQVGTVAPQAGDFRPCCRPRCQP